MTTYKIYFTNYSGFDNNFAFFSALPTVNNSGGAPVYSNVITSQWVPSDNGDTTWENDVTQTYYAWTSISPVNTSDLPGQNIVTKISNSKLATLGSSESPGSTFKLIDNGGAPTFDGKATTFNAPPGAFEIASDPNAFQPDQNFICGLGSVDGNGTRIPVATFAAQANTVAAITPVVKFYIAQFSAQSGTVIDVTVRSKKAAMIDFTGKATNAAWVKQQSGGSFDIRYGTAQAMLEMSRAASSNKSLSTRNPQSHNIAGLIELLKKKLDIATDTQYLCKYTWVGAVTQQQKAAAVANAATQMTGLGYLVNAMPEAPNFDPANFGVLSSNSIDVVRQDWTVVVGGLGAIANNPRTINASFVENGNALGYSNGEGDMRGIEQNKKDDTNGQGNGIANGGDEPFANYGHDTNQLAQFLKSVKGLDIAA